MHSPLFMQGLLAHSPIAVASSVIIPETNLILTLRFYYVSAYITYSGRYTLWYCHNKAVM